MARTGPLLIATTIAVCFFAQVNSAEYLGKFLGQLSELHHGVSGEVYAVDGRTLHIKDFTYDGQGPAAYFYASTYKTADSRGFRLRDENNNGDVIRKYRKEPVTLTLPEGKTLNNIKIFYVWCEEFDVNFGDIKIPRNFDFPRPQKIDALKGVHSISSDNIVIVDAQTLLIPNLHYDGGAPGAFRQSWQDGTLQTVRKKTGEGVRYIILHAGSEDGFVENASLIFKAGSNSGDYHNSMNSDNFEKWFEHQLIPNLEEPSLIIMDNAPYHSRLVEKIPNQSWTKGSLIEWLQHRQIPFPNSAMKDEIWNIAKKYLPSKRYRLDELALQHGHRVLRLPPYHCDFNPIEMVWSECKRYYDSKVSSVHPVTNDKVLSLWNEALEKVTAEKWKNYFRHTNELIAKSWERERLIDASDILPVIVDLNDSDSSDFSEEE